MKRFKRNYKLFIALMTFWMLINMSLKPLNIIVGIVISLFVANFSEGILYNSRGYIFKPLEFKIIIPYLLNLFVEIYKSSFSYIIRIIKKDCTPLISEIELKVKEPLIISIISSSITLTPGTLTINADKNKLTVLSLNECSVGKEAVERKIREKFESYFI